MNKVKEFTDAGALKKPQKHLSKVLKREDSDNEPIEAECETPRTQLKHLH